MPEEIQEKLAATVHNGTRHKATVNANNKAIDAKVKILKATTITIGTTVEVVPAQDCKNMNCKVATGFLGKVTNIDFTQQRSITLGTHEIGSVRVHPGCVRTV